MELVNSVIRGGADRMEIRSQVELLGEPFKTFKFLPQDTLNIRHQATILEQKNIGGDIMIWGNQSFGEWGKFKWGNEAAQSFILGLSKLGINALGDKSSEFEVMRVIPPNNLFREQFLTDFFIDDETTAETGVYEWI